MPINERSLAKFHCLEGITSALDAMTDPAKLEQLDAYKAWEPGYESPPVEIRDDVVDGPHGPIPVRVYRPIDNSSSTKARPALVWLHGGGWLAGDLDMPEADIVARELAHRADVVVISVDYRLAVDGVTFPVPHDDVVAAYRWAVRNASGLCSDPLRTALGGASAGGNLACGAALRLRDDADDPAPHRLLLAYPAVHGVLPPKTPDHEAAMAEVPPVLRFTTELVKSLIVNFLGHDFNDPHDIPAYAMPANGDLRGLPPTTIITSEYDDLRPSGDALAHRLEQVGVPVRLFQEAGALHGHLDEDPRLSHVDQSLAVLADALRWSQC